MLTKFPFIEAMSYRNITIRSLIFIFAFLLSLPGFAQKKEISAAKANIKKKTNLDNAEQSMRDLLKDSANTGNIKIYHTLAEAVRAQYEMANEKLYLKEQYDTVSFFNTALKMFVAFESLDSMDAKPDVKGQVKLKYRKKNAEFLSRYRQNLYNGGLFFVRRQTYDKGYSMMDAYLDCLRQPLFTGYEYADKNKLSSAAFWAIFCAYRLNRPDSALKYRDLALSDMKYKGRSLQFLSEIYLLKKDTSMYVESLRAGFELNMKSRFFVTRLVDYYNANNMLDSSMYVVDKALERDSCNALFLLAKSNIQLNMGRYQECISTCDKIIGSNPDMADAYYNAGISYLNMAVIMENKSKIDRKTKKTILDYYKKSLPYLEKYRELEPEKEDKWATSLYNIYFKLNMGKQFEEMSDILRRMNK